VHVRFAQQHARIIDEIARRKVVRSVEHDIVLLHERHRICRREPVRVQVHVYMRIQIVQTVARRLEPGSPHVARAMQDLSLQVGDVNPVVVDQPDRPHTGGGEIERRWRPESTGPDDEHTGGLEPLLSLDADIGQGQMPCIAVSLVGGECRKVSGVRSAKPILRIHDDFGRKLESNVRHMHCSLDVLDVRSHQWRFCESHPMFAIPPCAEEAKMSRVRVLVGTRKGAFILTSDGARTSWEVEGPHFPGWEMYHIKGSPVDPDRLYASQSSGWFGQVIQRSDDGGKTWNAVDNSFAYDGVPGTHMWYDGTPHPWVFKRVWHLEPSLTDRDTVYAGVEDAALF